MAKEAVVDSWTGVYFEKVVDYMQNNIHLPSWMTHALLHEDFLKNMKTPSGGKF